MCETVDPIHLARRLRAIVPAVEQRRLEVRFIEARRAMWRRVAETMPEMTITAVMRRWAQEIAGLSLAEQRRAGHDKLAVLNGLGYSNAETLVNEALARAERLGEEILRSSAQARRDRGLRRG